MKKIDHTVEFSGEKAQGRFDYERIRAKMPVGDEKNAFQPVFGLRQDFTPDPNNYSEREWVWEIGYRALSLEVSDVGGQTAFLDLTVHDPYWNHNANSPAQYQITVYWGDGSSNTATDANSLPDYHQYTTSGTYNVSVSWQIVYGSSAYTYFGNSLNVSSTVTV